MENKIGMSDMLAMVSLSDGNPGCLQALTSLRQEAPEIFPQLIMVLMAHDFSAEQIYRLWNDACGRDTKEFAVLLKAIRSGVLPLHHVWAALYGYDMDAMRRLYDCRVKERAPWMDKVAERLARKHCRERWMK